MKIRNNLYTCISGETNAPLANRYQIAGALTPTSYLSHHSAMEYYGISNQVFYEIYVSSKTSFRDFEFDGYMYRYICSKCDEGIEIIKYSGGIRVSDKERAVVDSIKDMDKIAGVEEVVENIHNITALREDRLLAYLECYKNQFLYQKTGFLLKSQQQRLGLSEDFFRICKDRVGASKRYLTKDCKKGKYDDTWRLIVPVQMYYEKNGG